MGIILVELVVECFRSAPALGDDRCAGIVLACEGAITNRGPQRYVGPMPVRMAKRCRCLLVLWLSAGWQVSNTQAPARSSRNSR